MNKGVLLRLLRLLGLLRLLRGNELAASHTGRATQDGLLRKYMSVSMAFIGLELDKIVQWLPAKSLAH